MAPASAETEPPMTHAQDSTPPSSGPPASSEGAGGKAPPSGGSAPLTKAKKKRPTEIVADPKLAAALEKLENLLSDRERRECHNFLAPRLNRLLQLCSGEGGAAADAVAAVSSELPQVQAQTVAVLQGLPAHVSDGAVVRDACQALMDQVNRMAQSVISDANGKLHLD
jgi:hypothetical protein